MSLLDPLGLRHGRFAILVHHILEVTSQDTPTDSLKCEAPRTKNKTQRGQMRFNNRVVFLENRGKQVVKTH